MSIYTAINSLQANIPRSVAEAQSFLDKLPSDIQEQLICAIYLGREHIHSSQLRDDIEISRSYTDHVSQDEYARILHEKGSNVITYLKQLDVCAKASGFDLNTL